MDWAQIKKSVNSDLNTPLNSKIDTRTNDVLAKFGFVLKASSNVNIATYGMTTGNPITGEFVSVLPSPITSDSKTTLTCANSGIVVLIPQFSSTSEGEECGLYMGTKWVTKTTAFGTQYGLADIVGFARAFSYNSGVDMGASVVVPVTKGQTYYLLGKGRYVYYAFGGGL